MNTPVRILVVEDAKTAQVVAKSHLTELGCLVDVVDNGTLALEKCNAVRYNMILMDLSLMPGPDGFASSYLIKNQSKLNKDTPIWALTIHSEAQFNEQAQKAGISGFLHKPFTRIEAQELVDTIKKNQALPV